MSLVPFGLGTSHEKSNHQELVAEYQRLWPKRFRLNNELVRRLPTDVVQEGAKRLGMFRRGTFHFGNEHEASVLMDYCIYNIVRGGRNAVERYLAECPPEPGSDEMICLHAMQHATYSMIAIERVERSVGCHVQDLFTGERRLLIDMGFSQSCVPGGVLLTRLLGFGEYITAGGAALPLGVLKQDSLNEFEQELRRSRHDPGCDPAQLIREALRRECAGRIVYAEPGVRQMVDSRDIVASLHASAHRRGEPALRFGRAPGTQRCRCGSGKMYKNCCGKKRAQG